MVENCGISALGKIRGLKGVSAFSLIHLARDNGLDLRIFKVAVKDLPLVHRPAIFHATNHFEYIENGNALPDLKWSGYVLTEKPMGTPVSLKEAKGIKGEGPAAAAIPFIFKAVAIALPVVIKGAIIGAGTSAAIAGITGGNVGKAAASGAKFGAIAGGAGSLVGSIAGATAPAGYTAAQLASRVGSATTIGATLAGAGQGAVANKENPVLGAVTGGIGGYGVNAGITGIDKFTAGWGGAKGAALATGGNAPATLGQRASAGFQNIFGGTSSATPAVAGVSKTASGQSVAGIPFGGPGATPTAIPTPAGLASGARFTALAGGSSAAADALNNSVVASKTSPTFTTPGVNPASQFTSGLLPGSARNLATGQGIIGPKIGGAGEGANFSGFLNSEVGKNLSKMGTAGAISSVASGFGPKQPTTAAIDPVSDFTTLRSFLGDTKLPAATEQELIKYVNTPLADIVKEQSFQSNKTFRKINDSYDRQAANLNRQFAQAGQNVRNSSDLRNELGKLEKDRATSLAEAEQEISNQNLVNAIQAKQFALSASLEKNQWDNTRAYELADLIGKKEALDIAIQQDNYDDFQDIVSQLLQIGFPNEQTKKA